MDLGGWSHADGLVRVQGQLSSWGRKSEPNNGHAKLQRKAHGVPVY